MRRRRLLVGTGVAAATTAAAVALRKSIDGTESFQRANTTILRATAYDGRLVELIGGGLATIGFDRARVRGRSVLLKPNLVEPSRTSPHVNTHPLFVRAVAEAFRRLDAREVLVGEGAGHVRDTRLVLDESGLDDVLAADRVPFIDLNTDDLFAAPNALGTTALKTLHLPRTLRRADLIVSLPKMKTHHWVGVTLSMKNLFGVMPGAYYGWPKNALHVAGIESSILDINATVRPHLAIVDGVIGMEGDGPIMGTPKSAGVVVLGTNLAAVDATAARLMGFDPMQLPYLRAASGRLGPILASHIHQRGERLEPLVQRFALPDRPHFKQFRASSAPAGA